MRTTDTTSTTDRARIRRVIAAAAVGVLACGGMSACSAFTDKAKSTKDTAATTTSVPATSVVAPTTVDATAGGGSQGNGTPGGGSGNAGGGSTGNTGGGTTGGGGTPAAPGPVIQSFTTPDDIDCHNGNLQEFTASWTTQNATKVTISIDGPGVYDTYGASGSTSLPFNCSSAHTFLLTAYGADGRTATRQVTLQPRNAQTADPGDSTDQ